MTQDEMQNRFSYQLTALADIWADRDPAYAKELRDASDSQKALEALRNDPLDVATSLTELWDSNGDDARKTKRTVVDTDGNNVKWDSTGWEQIEHTVRSVSEDGEKWTMVGEGTLHNPETGQWLAYRFNDDNSARKFTADGKIANSLDEAAGHLSNAERAQLGLPVNRPAPVEVKSAKMSADEYAKMKKDALRYLVADSADPDVALDFFTQMKDARQEAIARGATRELSFNNRLLVAMQSARRGAKPLGWTGGVRQWEKEGRVLKPGALPAFIYHPVSGASKSVDEDGDEDTSATSGSRSRSKRVSTDSGRPKFRLVGVYDWSQTVRADGQPDPDWKHAIPGGSQAVLDRLKAVSPLPVEFDHAGNTLGTAHGWASTRKIMLDPNKSIGNQISTLAHELTHVEADHIGRIERGEITKAQAEQEAQLGAYLVFRTLGMGDEAADSMRKASAAYLTNWVNNEGEAVAGHKKRQELLAERFDLASEAGDRIIARMGLGAQSSDAQEGARQAA